MQSKSRQVSEKRASSAKERTSTIKLTPRGHSHRSSALIASSQQKTKTDKAYSVGTFSSTSAGGNNSSSKKRSKIRKRSSSLKRSLGQLSKEISIFNSGEKDESDDSVRHEF